MKKQIFLSIIIGSFLLRCAYPRTVLLPPKSNGLVGMRDLYSIVVMIDGARIDVIDQAVRDGKLPAFKKLFYDQGARFENALTVFPTVSTPGHEALLSGLYPGHHGTPNLDWFSRPLKKYYDYLNPKQVFAMNTQLFNFKQLLTGKIVTDQPQQFFEVLHGVPTMAILEPIQSGASITFPKKIPWITAYQTKFEKYYEQCDEEGIKTTLEKFRKLPFEDLPRFSLVLLFSTDLIGHYTGPSSERAVDNYIQIDRFLRDLMTTLQQRGIADKTVLVLTSDHGQHELDSDLHEFVDLKKYLWGLGFKIDKKYPANSEVMFGDHGTAFANLYFRVGDDWKDRPTYHDLQNFMMSSGGRVNLIQKMLEHPHIEWVVAQDGPWVTHLHRRQAHAVIERVWENGKFLYRYLPDPGDDPLGYLANPAIQKWVQNKQFVGEEAWLAQTHDAEIPDGVVSMPQIFDDYRVGEMVILTDQKTQFKDNRISSHGSVFAQDKRVPLFFHGPMIRPGVYPYARTVDLFPTLLNLLGVAPPGPVDGVVRGKIFSETLPLLAFAQQEGGMDIPFFRNFLQEKLKNPANVFEQEKATQLIYSIEQWQLDHNRYAMPGLKILPQTDQSVAIQKK